MPPATSILRFRALVMSSLLGLAVAVGSGCETRDAGTSKPVILACTTSLRDSGLLDRLLEDLAASQPDLTVRPVVTGSGKAIALCRRGEADVLIAHSPKDEERLLGDGLVVDRRPLMVSDFVIVGPPADPARLRGQDQVSDALTAISAAQVAFVSRDDRSGTHQRELALWATASTNPHDDPDAASWLIRSGQGMGKTLLLASQRQAYTLSDRPTFLVFREHLDLEILVAGDARLRNPYHVMRVSSIAFAHVETGSAARLLDWLTSPRAQAIIGDHGQRRFGKPVYQLPDQPTAAATALLGTAPAPAADTGGQLLARSVSTALHLIATGDPELISIVWLTLRISGGAAILAVLAGLPLGALLALARFPGRRVLLLAARTGMALPPVAVGLVIGVLFWRTGPLGQLGLLYTPWAMALAQLLIALPIVAALSSAAIANLDPTLDLQLRALGASPWQRTRLLLAEATSPLAAASLAGFGRAISEVGASLMVGGNIHGETQVLTTASVLKVSRGEFEHALALVLTLVVLALGANVVAALLEHGSVWPAESRRSRLKSPGQP